MTSIARPVLDAIVNAAVDVTAASVGWLLMVDEDGDDDGDDGGELVVVAAAGGDAPQSRLGRRVPVSGVAGLVIASEQPAAIDTPPSDTSNVGAGGLDGNPAGVLAAPCAGDEDVVGVLEVARPEGSGPFTVDDVEEVTLLARVAGAALEEMEDAMASVPSPDELLRDLERLAATDPARYAALARLLASAIGSAR